GPIFPRRFGQHIHRKRLDVLVGKHLEIGDFGGLDTAFTKGLRDAFVQVFDAIAKSLRSLLLHSAEARDGETVLLRESEQFLVAHQPNEYRAYHAFELREWFFEA